MLPSLSKLFENVEIVDFPQIVEGKGKKVEQKFSENNKYPLYFDLDENVFSCKTRTC